jgi:signal transduction histidine kinase
MLRNPGALPLAGAAAWVAVLAPAADRAAYRIVQEALTNSRRHAGPATATVLLRYAGDGLTVQVGDGGTGHVWAGEDGGGNGVAGMRERAQALGGSSEIGPRPEGGFRVRAHLPVAAGRDTGVGR